MARSSRKFSKQIRTGAGCLPKPRKVSGVYCDEVCKRRKNSGFATSATREWKLTRYKAGRRQIAVSFTKSHDTGNRPTRHERSECKPDRAQQVIVERSEFEPDRAKQKIDGASGEGPTCDKYQHPHPTLSQREMVNFRDIRLLENAAAKGINAAAFSGTRFAGLLPAYT